jgi:hypothetical protein
MENKLSKSVINQFQTHEDRSGKYYFYHKVSSSQPPKIYQHLVSQANSDVYVWDPYFNTNGNGNDDHLIFESIGNGITISLLTQKGISPGSPYLNEILDSLKLFIHPSKNTTIGIHIIDKGIESQEKWLFHDRFLILDRTTVFIVGASLGWHIKSQNSTGIYRVTDQETANFIISIFDEYWNIASNKFKHRLLHS